MDTKRGLRGGIPRIQEHRHQQRRVELVREAMQRRQRAYLARLVLRICGGAIVAAVGPQDQPGEVRAEA